MTSHDVVAILRGLVGQKRIGHTGTLDPMATGVLPVCLGQATRIADHISGQGKTYIGGMVFGFQTDTLDITGDRIREGGRTRIPEDELLACFRSFTGIQDQRPPMYSAVKVKGKKLYELARKGLEIDRPSRKIHIRRLEILDFSPEEVRFLCSCSKGTYIRQLVDDIGKGLSTYATLTSLERTEVGPFHVRDAVSIMALKEGKQDWRDYLFPVDFGLADLVELCLSAEEAAKAVHGAPVVLSGAGRIDGLREEDFGQIRIYGPDGFIGIGGLADDGGLLKMLKVFNQE